MREHLPKASPRFTARMVGLCYVLMTLAGVLATLARRGLIVTGDAAATATNILAHPSRFQAGLAGDFLVVAFYIGVTALLYVLLRPVDRTIVLLATCFSLVACAIQGMAEVFQLAPLVALSDASYLSVFTRDQLQAMAFLSLKVYSQAYGIALVFFAFYGVLIGYLVYRSIFLPRIVGLLLVLGAAAWLTFLSPALGASLFPYNAAGGLGEAILMLWLLIAGVNDRRWQERAGAEGP